MKNILILIVLSILTSPLVFAGQTMPDVKTLVTKIKSASNEERLLLINAYKETLSLLNSEERKALVTQFKVAMKSAGIGQKLNVRVQQSKQIPQTSMHQNQIENNVQSSKALRTAIMATKQHIRQNMQINQALRKKHQETFLLNHPNFTSNGLPIINIRKAI